MTRTPTILCLGLLACWQSPALAQAQAPFLVKDVHAVPDTASMLGIAYLTDVGGTLYYTADNGLGWNLWKSDGTAAGTAMIKDTKPGSISNPYPLANLNGVALFKTEDATHGLELWRSDGTFAGTTMVRDIFTGSNSSDPGTVTVVNGIAFFAANDATNGRELWKSDGTTLGTVLVKNINPGVAGSSPGFLTDVNGTLYFVALDATNGWELWKSDGTTAGTVLVRDILPGSANSSPSDLVNVNGTLFFVATSSSLGRELWKSNGTSAGTVMVSDIYAGTPSSVPFGLTNVNGTLLFAATDATHGCELWKSDGTISGTLMVKDIASGFTGSIQLFNDFQDMGGTLFFVATDWGAANGKELWKSDGTTAGTILVKDIAPGATDASPTNLTVGGGTLFFAATEGINGRALWKSDGTTAGTVEVRDFAPESADPAYLAYAGGTLYFVTPYPYNGSTRFVLWKSDGTTAGTQMVQVGTADSSPSSLTNVDGTLFFAAEDGVHGMELWKSDGTAAGTVMVRDIVQGANSSGPQNFAATNGRVFFQANDGVHARELWSSDGTTAGTTLARDINPEQVDEIGLGELVAAGGKVFFRQTDGISGIELWTSDGTTAGTVLLKDIAPGPADSYASSLTNWNGILYFAAMDGSHGGELWRSDGTSAGTVMVKDIYPGPNGSGPGYLAVADGLLYFFATDGSPGLQLWRSDGTSAGTTIVKAFPSAAPYTGGQVHDANGTLFFAVNAGYEGAELWKTDGTAAGTVLVKDIAAGAASSSPGDFRTIAGTTYFRANDGVNGQELWKTDGTAAGTVMVKDIAPGGAHSGPFNLLNANGTLHFLANDGPGYAAWRSDGTGPGTVMVKAGAINALNEIALACPLLFFAGGDPGTGTELWAVDVGPGGATWLDLDGDGYGSGASTVFCAGTPGYVAKNADCDDTDPNVHPSATDATCNGVDNNCGGQVDEGRTCVCVENGLGLVGWWRGNGSTLDEVGGNHGTPTGGVGHAAGRVGEAFSFNGTTAYVSQLGDQQSFSFIENTGVFTIAAWILLNDVGEATKQAITASTVTSSEKGHFFCWDNSAGEQLLTLALTQGGARGAPIISSHSPSHVITTNGWHHVAAVGNGTRVTFYVDGVAHAGTGTMTGRLTGGSTRPVDLGRCPSSTLDCLFHGLIDEVLIHDRSSSMSEIRAIFDAGVNGTCGIGCLQTLQDLVGWWPGNGDGNDRSASNLNASLGPGIAFSTGKVGQAFDFNGSTHAQVPDHASLEMTTQLTLAAWIRPTGGLSNNAARILSKWSTGGAYELLFDSNNDRLPRVNLSNDGTNLDALTGPSSLPTNAWTHVATTFDAGVWKLYVNGAEVASKVSPITSIFSGGTSPLYLGAYSAGTLRFSGGIDEPMVLNRSLTAFQIQAIYDAESSGMCSLGQVTGVGGAAPAGPFHLSAPWPNPSFRITHVRFQLPTETEVRVEVFDVAGRRIATPIRGRRMPAGEQHVTWDGNDGSGRGVSGVFQIRVTAGRSSAVRQVVRVP